MAQELLKIGDLAAHDAARGLIKQAAGRRACCGTCRNVVVPHVAVHSV